jgi:hypothetical protein
MGDNCDDSGDSRVLPQAGGVGLVPVENLVGRVDVALGRGTSARGARSDLESAPGPAAVALLLARELRDGR